MIDKAVQLVKTGSDVFHLLYYEAVIDEGWDVQVAILHALKIRRSPDDLGVLTYILKQPEIYWELINPAADALIAIGQPAIPDLLELIEGVPEQFSYMGQRVAVWVIIQIGHIDAHIGQVLTSALFRTLDQYDESIGRYRNDPENKADDIVEHFDVTDLSDNPHIEPTLIKTGLSHPESFVRSRIVNMLSVSERTFRPLFTCLFDKALDEETREYYLIRRLARYDGAMPFLRGYVQTENNANRFYALSIWLQMDTSPSLSEVDFITDDIIKSLIYSVYEGVIGLELVHSDYGLYEIMDNIGKRVVPPLLDIVQNDITIAKYYALRVLKPYHDVRGLLPLTQLLQDGIWMDDESVKHITRAEVQEALKEALAEIIWHYDS